MEVAETLFRTLKFLPLLFLVFAFGHYTLGIVILVKNPREKTNRLFFLECVVYGIGCLGYGLAFWTTNKQEAFICIGIASIGYCLVWPVTLQFLLQYFFEEISAIWKVVLDVMYIVAVFYIVTWFTGLTASKDLIRVESGWIDVPNTGIFFYIYLAYCILCYLSVFIAFIIAIVRYNRAKKNKTDIFGKNINDEKLNKINRGIKILWLILVSYFFTSFCALFCNIVVPKFKNPIPSIGFLFLVINIAVTTYAMIRYRMFVLKNEIAPNIVDNAGEIIIALDESFTCRYANNKFFDILEWKERNCELVAVSDFLKDYSMENMKRIISNEEKEEVLKNYSGNKTFTMKSTCKTVNIGGIEKIFIITFSDIDYKIMEYMQNNNVLLNSLSEAAEGKSVDFKSHIQRVAKISVFIAELIKKFIPNTRNILPTDDIIEGAAKFHDIGKIKISDSILNKPSKLTEEEFEQIKEHSWLGYQITKSMTGDIAKYGSDVTLNHHEKWDGTGYPSGKKHEEIPLIARIVTIADVFDALISKRCYKNSMTPKQVQEEFKKQSGKQFDPSIINLLFEKKENKSYFDEMVELYYSIV